jgi:uncharacterized coiled-coil protein SlyX
MPDTAHRPSYEELQQRLRDIEIKQEQGIERLAAMRAAGFRMDAELRELRAALQRLNEVRMSCTSFVAEEARGGTFAC